MWYVRGPPEVSLAVLWTVRCPRAPVDLDSRLRRGLLVELRDGVHHAQASARGAFRIVVARLRPAEIGHHAIAQILGDVTAVASYPFGSGAMIGTDQLAPFFRIKPSCDFG